MHASIHPYIHPSIHTYIHTLRISKYTYIYIYIYLKNLFFPSHGLCTIPVDSEGCRWRPCDDKCNYMTFMSFCLLTRNGLGDGQLIIHGTVHPNLGSPQIIFFGWLVSVCIIRNSPFMVIIRVQVSPCSAWIRMTSFPIMMVGRCWEWMHCIFALEVGTRNDDKQSKCWDRPEGFMAGLLVNHWTIVSSMSWFLR